jgi:hypothetical protein
MKILINGVEFKATRWNQPMPQRGQDAPVPIRLNGERTEALITRNGVPPQTYSYFRIGDQAYWIKVHIAYDAEVKSEL